MRLINTSTLTLHTFYDANIPDYAILSHTWGLEEVTFQNFHLPSSKTLDGYSKITSCCALARSDGWLYVWVDTCCIDKTSSAELSEAINSMYRWYRHAQVCYAYMIDVTKSKKEELTDSRWFTRGWTLQELLAPSMVVFYDREWKELGTKSSLEDQIYIATGIYNTYLTHFDPSEASVAAKMSWAAKRKTTRIEDISYCLMGLFNVNIPLLYGEGLKAFTRLQEAILRETSDESLFAWRDSNPSPSGLFACSPDAFATSGDIVPKVFPQLYRPPSMMTNRGLEIDTNWVECIGANDPLNSWGDILEMRDGKLGLNAILLNCAPIALENAPIIIPLQRMTEESYIRYSPNLLLECKLEGRTRRISCSRGYIKEVRNSIPSRNTQKPHFHVTLSRSNYGFSLCRERKHGFTTSDYLRLIPEDDGGFSFEYLLHPLVFLFKNSSGENFSLQVDFLSRSPTLKVYVPTGAGTVTTSQRQGVDVNKTESYFKSRYGSDRISRCLQAGTEVSISMRKKKLFDRYLVYWIELRFSSVRPLTTYS